MKQKDIALIIVIAAISAAISFFVSTKVFSGTAQRQQKVPTVDVISDQFTPPSNKYFNSQSIDPAQEVVIGNSNNQNPFNGSTNQ